MIGILSTLISSHIWTFWTCDLSHVLSLSSRRRALALRALWQGCLRLRSKYFTHRNCWAAIWTSHLCSISPLTWFMEVEQRDTWMDANRNCWYCRNSGQHPVIHWNKKKPLASSGTILINGRLLWSAKKSCNSERNLFQPLPAVHASSTTQL